MNENKMITYSMMAEIMNDYFPTESIIDYRGMELRVRHVVPVAVMKTIVDNVTSGCFDKETGEYMPEFKEFGLKLCIVEAYTNVELPGDIEAQYNLLYNSDLMENIIPAVSAEQLDEIERAIRDRCRVINDANRVAFEHELAAAMQSVTQIAESFAGLFDGISQGDIQNLVKAIGTNGIDEEKIVKAVVSEQNALRGENEASITPLPLADGEDKKE